MTTGKELPRGVIHLDEEWMPKVASTALYYPDRYGRPVYAGQVLLEAMHCVEIVTLQTGRRFARKKEK